MKTLADLHSGEEAVIVRVLSEGEYSKRLSEMGFIRGRCVKVIKNAPLRDPIEYELMGYRISLRRAEAQQIEVFLASEVTEEELKQLQGEEFFLQNSSDFGKQQERGDRAINIALIGNPNCGKTTLFNQISGLDEHVGNYSGVTVELKRATVTHRGYAINITDLPGTYSLSTFSPEEKIVRDELESEKYDFIINVVDATLLERNLYLTTQLMDMARHIIVALNMYDELRDSGDSFNHEQMGRMLDIPFIPTVARRGEGIFSILDTVVERYSGESPHTHVESNFGLFIEQRLNKISESLEQKDIYPDLPRRYLALNLIEGDEKFHAAADDDVRQLSNDVRQEIESEYKDNINQVMADSRYGYIAGALKETLKVNTVRYKQSQQIDSVLTHHIWGFPVFFAIIWLMFWATFTLGAYPQDWIDMGVSALADFLSSTIPTGAFHDLLIEGIIGGVGSVIVFLPNILILFLFISILEDSGYMARAAFIMDRVMHKIGLHGKSFVPMIMGFGCNVPAIMASRIIENKSNRLLTVLIIPLMSCSARLPVYILLIGAFFAEHATAMLFGLYFLGVSLAVLTSIVFKRFFFSNEDHPFVMELPPYRMPNARNTLKHMWNKGSQYLRKMGGVILVGAVIIWAMGYYPTKQDSYLEKVGRTIEPVVAPLGFDWKIGVSLVSGIAAKEIVVSTLGVLQGIDEDGGDGDIVEKMKQDKHEAGPKAGEPVFNQAVALSLLVFVLIYFPCLAVIAAIRRECNSWSWAIFSMFYTTALAWVMSFIVYRLALIFM